MKRCVVLLLVLICICFVSCDNSNENNTSRQKVTVNMPKDNTVNGYRVSQPQTTTSSLPDVIATDNVEIAQSNPSTSAQQSATKYCANKNSKVFHKANCSSVSKMKEENKAYFSNRAELITQGYSPCKTCNP